MPALGHLAHRPFFLTVKTTGLRGFAAMSSTSNLFACVCSWQEDLVVCLSSAYRSTGVPRRLFSGIAAEGIEVTLYANEVVTG